MSVSRRRTPLEKRQAAMRDRTLSRYRRDGVLWVVLREQTEFTNMVVERQRRNRRDRALRARRAEQLTIETIFQNGELQCRAVEGE